MSFVYKPPSFSGVRIPDPKDGLIFAVCRETFFLGTHVPTFKGQKKPPVGVVGFLWDLETKIPGAIRPEWQVDGGVCASMSQDDLDSLQEKLAEYTGKPYRKSKKFNIYLDGDKAALPPVIEAHIGRLPVMQEIHNGFDFSLCVGRTVCLKLDSFSPEDRPDEVIQYVADVMPMQDPHYAVEPGDDLADLPRWVTEKREQSNEGRMGMAPDDPQWTGNVQHKPRTGETLEPRSAASLEAEAREKDQSIPF